MNVQGRIVDRSGGPDGLKTVYVVDDDGGTRSSIAALLGAIGLPCQAFERPSAFLRCIQPAARGCLLLDLQMPEMNGLDLYDELKRLGYTLPVIIITAHADVPKTIRAMKAGAFGLIEKPLGNAALVVEIERALERDAENTKLLRRRREILKRFESLTPRERQVKDLVIAGESNKVVAMDLGMSERTVEIHRARVMGKMGVRSLAQLVKLHVEILEHLADGA